MFVEFSLTMVTNMLKLVRIGGVLVHFKDY